MSKYTEAEVARLRAEYDPEATAPERKVMVETLATELGRSKRSVIARLSMEGVYVAVKRERKRAGTKADLVARIADALEVDEEFAESLEKANYAILDEVAVALEVE